MLDLWNNFSLTVFDALLGWLLYLPSDIVLIALALLTGGLMVLTRPLATNQNMLRRLSEDGRRIKQLIAAAKKKKDGKALERYRSTNNQIAMRKLTAEFKPLLLAIVPVALLATWAMARVEFHPPIEDEEIEVLAFAPSATAAGELIHIAPQPPDLEAVGSWIQVIVKKPNEPSWWERFLVWAHLTKPSTPEPDAVATWIIKGKARPEPYVLKIPFRDATVERKLLIGQTTYSEAVVPATNSEPLTTEIKMRPVRLFGIVPGWGPFLPAWLVGYIIIVVPLVFALKWAFGIY
jgi:uncharacterized membrane protein (DUF106 family)